MKDKLNARQKKFAEYYAQSGNTVQSAIKAGYSEKYANADACKITKRTYDQNKVLFISYL